MINKKYFLTPFLLCSFFIGHGQTTLFEGDIAIIGIDTEAEDFMFVTFVPLSAGTQIYFTDEEADGDYTIGAGEGTVLYTAPLGGVAAGTVIFYNENLDNFTITSDGTIGLSNDGDGIIAYQGASVGNITTFLHAVGETSADVGAFPDGFSTYVLIGNDDGEYYNMRTGGTAASYLTAINNSSNWTTSGSGVVPFDLTFFVFGIVSISSCATLFISEYIEGTSYNKFIEIYNPTNQVITLTGNYSIQIFTNGSNSSTTIPLVGTIDSFGVFVLANNQAALGITANQTSSSLNFTGNDAVALANGITIFDLVGEIGNSLNFAENKGLVRKNYVQNPIVNYDTSEWEIKIVDDVSNLGDHLGDCSFNCFPIIKTVWDGTNWSNGNPDNTKVAYINGAYNSSVNSSFTACGLVVNAGNLLTIANETYIEIENNVFVYGSINVETKGSFVQKNNDGIFNIKTGGSALVHKTTAPINAWYEYTYWSSPVSSETIGNALAQAPSNRRFWYNAQNYLDATAETENNNQAIVGQDDIDDNGNDWQLCLENDIMVPGVGYAATQSSSNFTGLGSTYNYTFSGVYNNGIISVPVYRNDSELLDTNWNFIGNPYPSAISVDAFFNENVFSLNPNGALDGAIYLWSQNTVPSSSSNGNEQLNFSQSDYAIINGIGSTATQNAGGDANLPNRFIPSGQGFFISFNNIANATTVTGNIKKSEVIFNNDMRVVDNNNQFFKSSKKNEIANKIWLDLTSNIGFFSQLLVGYVNGATNNLDNSFYDAPRNLSSGVGATIYSLADNSNTKLAIQGKSTESVGFDEEIRLGFYNTLNSSATFDLAISKIEGDFLTENTIYLQDNLLGITHNLSESNYVFSAEKGTIDNRFKIVFNNKILSVNSKDAEFNNLTINDLKNGNIEISIQNETIKKVEIIDFLGRTIYNFQGASNVEIYNISKLKHSIYFVKITLSNGKIIVKKAIKKE
jgi:hypothetical protein